ncbi:MAG: TrkA C-terminal domain-containing protein [Thermoproteota archaeon]|nr:TrkA C-terminal domain-containing protein [Thermoproteota archaeon]
MVISKETFKKVGDKLAELKDTCELMMDLAYSSLLLNSPELAREVQTLEEHVDDLHTEFELLVLSSGFKPKESKDFLGLIRLGVVTEEIADAAAEIAEVVLRGLKPHPVLQLVIKEAEETVTRVQVSEKSSLVGKTLREVQIPEETGMWVLCIRRGNRWIRPKPNVPIQAGDVLVASGYAEGGEDLTKLASGETTLPN